MKFDLTRRQRDIYDYIREYTDSYGFAPSNRDIATAFKIKSLHAVTCHLVALEKKGAIRRDYRKARAIQVVDELDEDADIEWDKLTDRIDELERENKQLKRKLERKLT